MFEIDYLYGLAGGVIIGLAAALYLLGNGRIMGASGIIGGLVDRTGWNDGLGRVLFLVGLVGAPALVIVLFGLAPETHLTTNIPVLIAAGLAVGFGTRLANGCTSGHGVCGISRFSLRGIVATGFYLLAGGVGVVLFRHILGVI